MLVASAAAAMAFFSVTQLVVSPFDLQGQAVHQRDAQLLAGAVVNLLFFISSPPCS